MSFFGHLLLFVPIIRFLSWIPLVGWLLASILKGVVFIFALVWSIMLHFLVLGCAWIVYRPLYGAAMLAGFGVCFYLINYGSNMTDQQALQDALDRMDPNYNPEVSAQ